MLEKRIVAIGDRRYIEVNGNDIPGDLSEVKLPNDKIMLVGIGDDGRIHPAKVYYPMFGPHKWTMEEVAANDDSFKEAIDKCPACQTVGNAWSAMDRRASAEPEVAIGRVASPRMGHREYQGMQQFDGPRYPPERPEMPRYGGQVHQHPPMQEMPDYGAPGPQQDHHHHGDMPPISMPHSSLPYVAAGVEVLQGLVCRKSGKFLTNLVLSGLFDYLSSWPEDRGMQMNLQELSREFAQRMKICEADMPEFEQEVSQVYDTYRRTNDLFEGVRRGMFKAPEVRTANPGQMMLQGNAATIDFTRMPGMGRRPRIT